MIGRLPLVTTLALTALSLCKKKQPVKNPQEKAPKGNEKKPTQTGENDKVQQKITSFQTAKGGSRVDNQDPILKELTTLGTMVLEINTKMNSMITKEEFQNKFEKLVTKSDLEKVVDRVKREITTEMTEQMDKLESRIFELEIKNDDLYKKMKMHYTVLLCFLFCFVIMLFFVAV